MATELLALRKERERAEPVAWLVCGSKTFKDRTASTREVAEQAVKDRKDGSSIKPLYTAPPAPSADDDSLPYDTQIAEYEQMMEAEQTQADTTSQQFESLASVKQQSSKDAATSKASRDSDANSSPDSQTTIKQSDGWIPCSERMPPENTGILVATEFDGPGDWRMKWGTRVPGHPDAKNGWFIPGASWTPSHWQPLPEPPCK
ncbi:DUF551 domain-containing protein [Cronobacter dublinensis]|nr:DUF551 domain-containing protein [Cronobacter dublinensis]